MRFFVLILPLFLAPWFMGELIPDRLDPGSSGDAEEILLGDR